MAIFARTIGIDYSGAQTPTASLKGLRVYLTEGDGPPAEVHPPPSPRKYWTRKGVAHWLVERLAEDTPALVGIDHGFSSPVAIFRGSRAGARLASVSRRLPALLADRRGPHLRRFRSRGIGRLRRGADRRPALWSPGFAREDRTGDQHDAYSIAAWLSRANRDGSLAGFLDPNLTPPERSVASVEGWILGVA